jgi:hypothetical protein
LQGDASAALVEFLA